MKFRDYLKQLNDFAKEHPETLDLETIYSKDSEGNEFNPVAYAPSKGFFEDKEFATDETDVPEVNAVCIN